MYLDYYGLNMEPFHITPDPRFFYLSPSHKESYASLIYGLKNRKGFISLTGEVGLGKTTVIRTFLNKWSTKSKIKTIFVFNPNTSFKGLLLTIYSELGLDLPEALVSRATSPGAPHATPVDDDVFELVRKLHSVLVQEYENGYNVILVIDDAQNMPLATMENLRMLSNLETTQDKLLQIFLIGQNELDSILEKKELRQLKQRIAVRATLKPLTRAQTREYILHRLEKAGAKNGREKIFTRGALKKIYKYSQGIPRNINIICDNALITGFGSDRRNISSSIIREVQSDLQGWPDKKKFRYAWVGGLLVLLLATGVWFSPYRDNLVAGIEEIYQANFSSAPVETTPSQVQDDLETTWYLESQKEALNEQNRSAPATQSSMEPYLDFEHMVLLKQAIAAREKDNGAEVDVQADALHQEAFLEEQKANPAVMDADEAALEMDPEDLAIHEELIQQIPAYSGLSRTRQEVLIRMARQTSVDGLMSFKRMLAALEEGNFQEASRQMVYSRWARAVGDYAYELAEVMRTGEIKED